MLCSTMNEQGTMSMNLHPTMAYNAMLRSQYSRFQVNCQRAWHTSQDDSSCIESLLTFPHSLKTYRDHNQYKSGLASELLRLNICQPSTTRRQMNH